MSNEGIEPDPRDPVYWRARAEQAEAACMELARRLTNQIEATEAIERMRLIEHDVAALFQAKYDDARAELAALRQAAIDLTNQLAVLRFPDESTLWRLGGQPLERDYQALKTALAASGAAQQEAGA